MSCTCLSTGYILRDFSNGESTKGIVDKNGVQTAIFSVETKQQSNTKVALCVQIQVVWFWSGENAHSLTLHNTFLFICLKGDRQALGANIIIKEWKCCPIQRLFI